MTDEIEKPEVEAEIIDTGAETEQPEAPVNLRDQLAAQFKEANDKAAADKPEPKPSRTANRIRNPDGTLAAGKTEVDPAVAPPDPALMALKGPAAAVEPPAGLPKEIKDKWAVLPPEVQAAITKREKEVHEGFTRHDEERNFGKAIKSVLTPYEAMIRSEGSDPVRAVTSLMETARLLRVSTPQQKGQMLWQLAHQFGADMSTAQQQQPQNQVHPLLQQTMRELQVLKSERENEKQLLEQQEKDSLQREIDTFSKKPESLHFQEVRQHMFALLQAGAAKGSSAQELLQDAYDQAVYANPNTRSIVMAAQTASQDAKRVADQKAKADAAKKAGVSMKGSPMRAMNGSAIKPGGSLRQQLESAFSDAREG